MQLMPLVLIPAGSTAAREVFDSEEGKELKKQWGVPEEYVGIGHCVLGYRDCEYPDAKPRKEGFVIRV